MPILLSGLNGRILQGNGFTKPEINSILSIWAFGKV